MAVISMGYADGYLRTGSGKAQVLLGGVKAPVLGRICMDMCMVRIPEGVDVHRGDEVTVFGPEAGRQRTLQTRRAPSRTRCCAPSAGACRVSIGNLLTLRA